MQLVFVSLALLLLRVLFYSSFVIMHTLGLVVFLGKLLVSQKLWVHTPSRHILGPLCFLNAIGVCLVRVVVRARVLLL